MTDDVRESGTGGRGWSIARLAAAAVTIVLTGLVAALLWLVGQAQYLEDYCATRAPQPEAATPEGLGGRPAYLDGPVTVRCEYDALPTVVVTDAGPLVAALVLALMVLAIAFGLLRWARPARP